MNHCLLEVLILETPKIRYTRGSKIQVIEMMVELESLGSDGPASKLKVVGWGNIAQDIVNKIQVGEWWVLEGSLRMSCMPLSYEINGMGIKEKKAELTLSRLYPVRKNTSIDQPAQVVINRTIEMPRKITPVTGLPKTKLPKPDWDTSPLVPDLLESEDEIPF
uniref:Single-stranded DNA-binding protein n=1 Tax=Paulinella chromatophora TaxID=39717 RepID=B1X5S0_PAUCH|nr:hypothetical protein PCC_0880 [Paulinella chromatophora]ACB43289.1 hypothetical protein PCC_0880 [Paulinella chromatophora]